MTDNEFVRMREQAVLAYLRFRHAQNARRLQAEGRNAV